MDIDADDEVEMTPPNQALEDCEADYEDNFTPETINLDDSMITEESDSDFEVPHEVDLNSWKTKRDMANGIQLNNSFTGPYPESYDGLHHDRGMNYQFSKAFL
jgi:hypothetical protein